MRFYFVSYIQAAETIALAAALLCGGTPCQVEWAKDFVATELAKHDQDLSNRLIEKLMGAAKLYKGGVRVSSYFGLFVIGMHLTQYDHDNISLWLCTA